MPDLGSRFSRIPSPPAPWLVEFSAASTSVTLLGTDTGRGRWWGEVQHVETGERIALRDQAKLLEFLRRHLRELEDTR